VHEIIDVHREALVAQCQRFGVRQLELFGSAASSAFDAQRSDVDFLVDFDMHGEPDLFRRYFGLNEALERILGRKVDLVMVGALKNPYFIDAVNETRRLIYAAPVAQTT